MRSPPSPRHHHGVTTVIDPPRQATASLQAAGSVLLHWSLPGNWSFRAQPRQICSMRPTNTIASE